MGRSSDFLWIYFLVISSLKLMQIKVPFKLEGANGVLQHLEHLIKTKGNVVICVAEGVGQYATGIFVALLLRFRESLKSGPDERSIPGNTIAIQADMPYHSLTTFGASFLSKFECMLYRITACFLLQWQTKMTLSVCTSRGEKVALSRRVDFRDWLPSN